MIVINAKADDRKLKGAKASNNFEKEAQAIWAEHDVERKRDMITNTMINKFKYVGKDQEFRNKVNSAKSGNQIDTLAASIMLYGCGLAVPKKF